MGLFYNAHPKHVVPQPHRKAPHGARSRSRVCRIEQMEPRQLLSVTPIHLGATYLEDHSGDDVSSKLISNGTTTTTQVADVFQVSYTGGVTVTTLTSLTINLHDTTLFDTVAGGAGYGSAFPLTIISHDGFQITGTSVADGGTQLVLSLSGWSISENRSEP